MTRWCLPWLLTIKLTRTLQYLAQINSDNSEASISIHAEATKVKKFYPINFRIIIKSYDKHFPRLSFVFWTTWAAWKLVSVHRLVSTAPLLPYTEAFGSTSMSSFFFQTYCISSEQSEQHRKTRLRFNWAEPGGDVELPKPISQTVGGILFQLYWALKQNKQTARNSFGSVQEE